jgi:Uma2 family endonuclease
MDYGVTQIMANLLRDNINLTQYIDHYLQRGYEFVGGHLFAKRPEIMGSDGELIVSPAKPIHNAIANYIAHLLTTHTMVDNSLDMVFGQETGFIMQSKSNTMRASDVAYVPKERLKEVDLKQWLPFPPDLAVEVVSEYDRASDVKQKNNEYMSNGTKLLWVVYPDEKEIEVHQPNQPVTTLKIDNTLTGKEILPGFNVPIKEIFSIFDD